MSQVTVNAEQRLYVIPCGEGYTCLGFDVAERWRREVLAWLKRPCESVEIGTIEAYAAYSLAMDLGAAHSRATGARDPSELVKPLIGLEGRRIEVTTPSGEKERFWLGKSTGWRPCHLAIESRRSDGGAPVYFPEGSTFRVIGNERL